MQVNQARLAHEAEGTDEPFDFANAIVPDIHRGPHAVSEKYRKEVSEWGRIRLVENIFTDVCGRLEAGVR
jgi:hypothetical protein